MDSQTSTGKRGGMAVSVKGRMFRGPRRALYRLSLSRPVFFSDLRQTRPGTALFRDHRSSRSCDVRTPNLQWPGLAAKTSGMAHDRFLFFRQRTMCELYGTSNESVLDVGVIEPNLSRYRDGQ